MIRHLAALVVLASSAAAAQFNSLFFFGDSLTDSGNVYQGTSVLGRYTFGLVPTEPSVPYVGGAFSNGPVWAEHVAQRLGHAQDSEPAGMSLGWFGQVGGDGNNYAVGGARTDDGGALGLLDFFLPTGMATQVDFYLSRTGGAADAGALYFLAGGGNDLRDATRIANPGERQMEAERAAQNILSSVETLYGAGARQFVLINSPNIGLIPESLNDGRLAEGADASWHFNTSLSWHMQYLGSLPDLSWNYFDLFGLHNELVAQYGFESIKACKDGPAESCDQTLFFDSIHPNAKVHAIIGNRVADQLLGTSLSLYSSANAANIDNPEPATVLLVLTAVAAMAIRRASRKTGGPA